MKAFFLSLATRFMALIMARWSGKREGRAQLQAEIGRDGIDKAKRAQEIDEHISQLGDERVVDELRDDQRRH